MHEENYTSNQTLDYSETISLLNVYLTEWSHRDKELWSKALKLYYAILVIILFPNITNFFNVILPSLPAIIFRVIGLLLSLIFLYVTFGYAIRFQAIADTYQSIINELPDKYRRKSIKSYKTGHLFSLKINYLLYFALFVSLFILSITLMVVWY